LQLEFNQRFGIDNPELSFDRTNSKFASRFNGRCASHPANAIATLGFLAKLLLMFTESPIAANSAPITGSSATNPCCGQAETQCIIRRMWVKRGFLFRQRQHEFVLMANTRLARFVFAIVPLDFEKAGNLSPYYSAACIVAASPFAISASARRYSTGITLRNKGR